MRPVLNHSCHRFAAQSELEISFLGFAPQAIACHRYAVRHAARSVTVRWFDALSGERNTRATYFTASGLMIACSWIRKNSDT